MAQHVRFRLVLPVLALLCLTGPVLPAQTATPEPAATEKTDTPKRARPVSNEVAAALAAVMPKYDPPKPVEPKSEAELADLRETDKPRNGIVRLPEYVVREKKPPVFRERDLLGEEGRAELAKRKYAGLGLSLLPGMNKDVARYMMQEEDRQIDMASFADLARTGSTGDAETRKYYKKLGQETYLRSNEQVTGNDLWSNGR